MGRIQARFCVYRTVYRVYSVHFTFPAPVYRCSFYVYMYIHSYTPCILPFLGLLGSENSVASPCSYSENLYSFILFFSAPTFRLLILYASIY
uniref:Putative ovule protein n=1 Tax=Solanum chacoense TaxID=4108 RepID=A0A0V0IFI5_SOLCH